jgi:hypothetical protein
MRAGSLNDMQTERLTGSRIKKRNPSSIGTAGLAFNLMIEGSK